MKPLLLLFTILASSHAAMVLLPDGTPAAGAKAVPLTTEHWIHISGTEFVRPVETMTLNAHGRLDVTPETAGRWVILHTHGWADLPLTPEISEVRLEPWCDLSGSAAGPHQPDARVSYHRTELPRHQSKQGTIFWTSTAPIAGDGSFSLRHVPKGQGSLGLLREVKTANRIMRWRDYVRLVEAPSPAPVNLQGGVTVSGRISSSDLPALITLAAQNPGPGFHGLTGEDGRFKIPGVLPGTYRLSARPDTGRSTRNLAVQDIHVDVQDLDLGTLQALAPEVEIDSRVEFDEGLVGRIRAATASHCRSPIQQIWIGELIHPMGNYGARISFSPQADPTDPTRAKQTVVVLTIPGEPLRKYYPEHDLQGYGFSFSTEALEDVRVMENSLRVFPLKTCTLHLAVDDKIDYHQALDLLSAIEAGTVQVAKPKDKNPDTHSWAVGSRGIVPLPSENLTQICNIRLRDDKTLELETRDRPFSGRSYKFQLLENGKFELLESAAWRS